jgi:ubiquinone biosynthesis protein
VERACGGGGVVGEWGMKVEPLARLERHAKRLGEIAAVAGRYGLSDLFADLPLPWLRDLFKGADGQALAGLTREARVREALTELGTTFIKLGQMLSTRADLVGSALAGELAGLQANVPADPASDARAILEEDFGAPLEGLFAKFEETALAAGSIAQVYRAVLSTGEAVVVKIRRAGIESRVVTDLEIVQALAELLEKHSTMLRSYQPAAIIRQFRRALQRELDFGHERRNLEEFARRFEVEPAVRIPRVFAERCSRRVLTMERLEGVAGTDVEAMWATGEDLAEFARRGATMYLEMVFRDGFYHADPHPGNLMLLPGGVVGVLDCGQVGRLDDVLRDEVEALLLAVVENDTDQVTDSVLRLGAVPPDCERGQLRADLDDFMADFIGQPLAGIQIGRALNSLIEIIRSHRITLPPPLALLLKTLILLEGTSRRFYPEFSLAELMEPFCRRMALRRLSPGRLGKRARRMLRDWDRLVTALPRDLADLLARFRDGTLTVHLDHRHLDPIVNRLVVGVLTAALFLGSSELWSREARPLLFGVSVFGALGYLTSIVLGWRLLRAIRKSGNIDSEE